MMSIIIVWWNGTPHIKKLLFKNKPKYNTISENLSKVESKNAPNLVDFPESLANAPSTPSKIPVRNVRMPNTQKRSENTIQIQAATEVSNIRTVMWLGRNPIFWNNFAIQITNGLKILRTRYGDPIPKLIKQALYFFCEGIYRKTRNGEARREGMVLIISA